VSRTAFNKENGPELLGQLLRVLKSNGMDESLDAVKRCGLTKKLNDEWMDDTGNRQKRKRGKRAGQRSLSSFSDDLHEVANAVDMTRKAYKPLAVLLGRLAKPRGFMDDPIFRSGYLEDVDWAIEQIKDIKWAAPTLSMTQSVLWDALSELEPLSKKLRKLQSRGGRTAGQSKEEKQDMVLKVLHDGGTIGSIEADIRKYFDSRMGSREIEKILLDLMRQKLVDKEVASVRETPAFEIWFLTSKGERSIKASLRIAAVDEKLMDRAAQVLQYHNERDAMKHLISEGVSRQDAYYAVKAGKILNEDRMKRRVALRHLAVGANK
jgi:hypothetical protein